MSEYQYVEPSDNMDILIQKIANGCEEAHPIIKTILQEDVSINLLLRLDYAKQTGIKLVRLYELCGSVSGLKKILGV